MRTARYWARATVTIDGVEDPAGGVVGLGWSDVGELEARRVALERAKRAAAKLRDDELPQPWGYPYPDRPIREEVIDEMRGGNGLTGAITRNSYGALILNTAKAMFIDIDSPDNKGGWLGSIFSGGRGRGDHAQAVAAKLHALCEANPGMGMRLYRTAAGLRVLMTSWTMDPTSDEAADIMRRLDADKQYMQLCRTQACYRARLTPKPWRCGVDRLRVTFPYQTDWEVGTFQRWLQTYEAASASYSVCELIAHIGKQETHADIRPMMVWHDELACRAGMPLA